MWKPSDMPGIPREVTEHCLNIKSKAKPVQQWLYLFNEERWRAIKDEIARVLAVDCIKEMKHPEWLANPILVKKKNGK
jgi:hypothetical protein